MLLWELFIAATFFTYVKNLVCVPNSKNLFTCKYKDRNRAQLQAQILTSVLPKQNMMLACFSLANLTSCRL